MAAFGRWCIGLGLLLVLAGVVLLLLARLGFSGPPRLPGDLVLRGRTWAAFVPLGTSVVLSLLLSGFLYLVARLTRQ